MSTRNIQRSEYDAIVVGARCAGAATAMLLARRGLRVLAVDRAACGSDTLSTHALMRGGVLQLHRWGLLPAIENSGTPPVRATSFHYGDEVVRVSIKARDGVDALYSPRRNILDPILVDAARASGVEVVHGVRLIDVVRSNGRVNGVLLSDADRGSISIGAGVVIGADGLRSTLGALVGAERYRVGRHAASFVYGYWAGLEPDGNHWYYQPGVSVGVIPTNAEMTCIFVAASPERFDDRVWANIPQGYRSLVGEASPELGAALLGAEQVESFRGFAGEVGFLRRSFGPGWALVGDAGYFRDPITAHGITDALRDAELLARAVARGSEGALAEYQALRDELSLRFLETTDAIASFDWDLDAVKELHLELSETMSNEVTMLAQLDAAPRGSAGRTPDPREEHSARHPD